MMRYQREYSASSSVHKTLSKDLRHKKLSGVCGGIANYYGFPRLAVRIAAIVALVMLPVATGVAYFVAALLMPSK